MKKAQELVDYSVNIQYRNKEAGLHGEGTQDRRSICLFPISYINQLKHKRIQKDRNVAHTKMRSALCKKSTW